MIKFTCITILCWLTMTNQQEDYINLYKLQFGGLPFSTSRKAVEQVWGQPKIGLQPEGCGYSDDDYQLIYKNFSYVGRDGGRFNLERLTFDPAGKLKLAYGHYVLSGLTTRAELNAIFPSKANPGSDPEGVFLSEPGHGQGARFVFVNGRLSLFEYWIEC